MAFQFQLALRLLVDPIVMIPPHPVPIELVTLFLKVLLQRLQLLLLCVCVHKLQPLVQTELPVYFLRLVDR